MKCSGVRHTATSSRAVEGAVVNRPCSRNPLSGFSTCIGWPRRSLAVDGLGLTFGRLCSGRFTKGALCGAVGLGSVLQAETKAFLEIPNGVDHGIDRPEDIVASWRNPEGKFTNASKLFEKLS